MNSIFTETQVAVLDTLRTILVMTTFRSDSIDPTLKAAALVVLEGQGLTWSQFIDFAAK
jgi:hypothetical protein